MILGLTIVPLGHARPLCILAARLVKLRPVQITLFVSLILYDRVKAEIARDFASSDDEPLSRIHFVPVDQGTNMLDPKEYQERIIETWNAASSEQSIVRESFDGARKALDLRETPISAVIVDNVLILVHDELYRQKVAGTNGVPLYAWLPVATNSVVPLYNKDIIPDVEALAERDGIPFDDAAREASLYLSREVIKCACLPPMYDYEFHPQSVSHALCRVDYSALMFCTGVLTFDAADYHPEATTAFRAWMAETGRKVTYAGPLVPSSHAVETVARASEAGDVLRFLDSQLAARGEHSVIFISFGTLFWPMDQAKLVAALELLMEDGVPFVFTHPSAKLPEDLLQKLQAYDHAFIAQWVPQQAVLAHEATGWALTHGGHNTVLECILAGVPMIVWPIVVDQPTNAIHLSEDLDVAYELLEVRNGTGLTPIYRTGRTPAGTLDAVRAELRGVLARAFGADGQGKRARLQGVRRTLEGAWAEGGAGRRDVEVFVDGL
ncbi:UDP-Glycosyltransferase/glycogen phosphorylase [Trametes versicolor FP-101664 SS1]|uniref:UDP-Glycosyltransferase/glycogen phosphorylase n=1 Tax=Trametes versicolor (strain FP-101664) TaxID=717944 RepID=UPI0004622971|nr:UDP-Glycosyltransferase/glycogen phosphorylase [Trametes versicolor FP-101664 SS1]EIW61191.1 UDP-Glycosyltransferase/glycogen phosphorylase [Trametes versicolor FP-101664 SS1]